jgi:sulfonate transport system ATP-binding protein
LRGISRRFGGRTILDGIDLEIGAGEFTVLVGSSGCGKSTLLRIVAGLDPEAEGRVEVTRSRAIVFQDARLLPWQRVWKNVVLGLDGSKANLRRRAFDALAEVSLLERAMAWPLTLSGGEAQRVGLSRALVRTPALLLMDEPFAALDALTRLKMQQQIAALWASHHLAVLLVTHDVEEALLLADRILLLDHGGFTRRFEVALPRPRDREHPAFVRMRRDLLLALGIEEPHHPNRIALSHLTTSEPELTLSRAV